MKNQVPNPLIDILSALLQSHPNPQTLSREQWSDLLLSRLQTSNTTPKLELEDLNLLLVDLVARRAWGEGKTLRPVDVAGWWALARLNWQNHAPRLIEFFNAIKEPELKIPVENFLSEKIKEDFGQFAKLLEHGFEFASDAAFLKAFFQVLTRVGQSDLKLRLQICNSLEKRLTEFKFNNAELNRLLIDSLLALEHQPAVLLIQRVFENDLVHHDLSWAQARQIILQKMKIELPQVLSRNNPATDALEPHYEGDSKMEKLLHAHGIEGSLVFIRASLLGEAVAIRPLEPIRALRQFIEAGLEEDFKWTLSRGQVDFFTSQFIALYNELLKYQDSFFDFAAEAKKFVGPTDQATRQAPAVMLSCFLTGFLSRVIEDDEAELSNFVFLQSLVRIDSELTKIHELEKHVEADSRSARDIAQRLGELHQELEQLWSEQYLSFVREIKILRLKSEAFRRI